MQPEDPANVGYMGLRGSRFYGGQLMKMMMSGWQGGDIVDYVNASIALFNRDVHIPYNHVPGHLGRLTWVCPRGSLLVKDLHDT